MLQKRHKCLVPQKNISPNTLVLIKEDTVPRGVWPKGIVVSVIPDRDEVCRRAVIRTTNEKEFVRDKRKLYVLEADVWFSYIIALCMFYTCIRQGCDTVFRLTLISVCDVCAKSFSLQFEYFGENLKFLPFTVSRKSCVFVAVFSNTILGRPW